ncbi:hypothetical protein J6590_055078 [Homalodisca vitripennis]|nr:hypothetical protein J6590_055078 [Homalodisca vitripennis]
MLHVRKRRVKLRNTNMPSTHERHSNEHSTAWKREPKRVRRQRRKKKKVTGVMQCLPTAACILDEVIISRDPPSSLTLPAVQLAYFDTNSVPRGPGLQH